MINLIHERKVGNDTRVSESRSLQLGLLWHTRATASTTVNYSVEYVIKALFSTRLKTLISIKGHVMFLYRKHLRKTTTVLVSRLEESF